MKGFMKKIRIFIGVIVPKVTIWWTEKGSFAGFSLHFRRNDVCSYQQLLTTYIKNGK